MRFVFFLSRRYSFIKSSNRFVNLISVISILGVTIGTAALVIVLSVFNGFENLVLGMYNSFDSDLKITSLHNKTFIEGDIIPILDKQDYIVEYAKILEEKALLKYNQKEYIATIKGVSNSYKDITQVDSFLIEGEYLDKSNVSEGAVFGSGVAYHLSTGVGGVFNKIQVYIPNRESKTLLNTSSLIQSSLIPVGVFSIQSDIDSKYIITSISYIQELLNKKNHISSVEIKILDSDNLNNLQKDLRNKLGEKYLIQNRFEQQQVLYKILKTEKLVVFLVLLFIMIISAFNIIGSLSMFILDKKKDIKTLSELGATIYDIRNIFFLKSMFTVSTGAIFGLIVGLIFTFVQMYFGIIKMVGNFVVESYPVAIDFFDISLIILVVLFIGVFTSWYPTRILIKKCIN